MAKAHRFYITFGQTHRHRHERKEYGPDCVAVIEAPDAIAAREIAWGIFGERWCWFYTQPPDMKYYPRGFVNVNFEDE